MSRPPAPAEGAGGSARSRPGPGGAPAPRSAPDGRTGSRSGDHPVPRSAPADPAPSAGAPRPVRRLLPAWLALLFVGLGGAAAAVQGAANAELGERVGDPTVAAAVNNVGGSLLIGLAVLALPSVRAGLAALRQARLPWWAYLGGLGGATIVLLGAYVVPVLGLALFTIAAVAGSSLGGLAVDRAGLAPVGRLALTGPRLAGALLGVLAVGLAQLGQPVGDLALGLVALTVAGGVGIALQSALNGRVSAASSPAAGVAVNFAVGTPVVLLVAALAGAFTGPAPTWPDAWYLYTGGLLGVGIVASLVVGVRVVGVLRTGLVAVAGQLGGALLLDALVPGGAGVRLPVVAGALLTLLAALVAGRGARSTRVAATGAPATGGRLVG